MSADAVATGATSVATRFRQGHWTPNLVQQAHDLARSRGDGCSWLLYLDILQHVCGISASQWQEIVDALTGSEVPAKLLLRLLYLAGTPSVLQDSEGQDRIALLTRLAAHELRVSRRPATTCRQIRQCGYLGTRLSHYPLLRTHLPCIADAGLPLWSRFGHSPVNRQWQAMHRDLPTLIDSLTPARDASGATEHPLRLAVVGNAPGLLAENAGDIIDAADLVIRFNNARPRSEHYRHTGRRTDIWVCSPGTPLSRCPSDARGIVVSGLHPLSRASFYWPRLLRFARPLADCPASHWYSLVRIFQAPPSAGTLLLASLRDSGHEIHCHGFTRQADAHQHQANHHNDSAPRSVRHNWQAESAWLRQCITESKALVIG